MSIYHRKPLPAKIWIVIGIVLQLMLTRPVSADSDCEQFADQIRHGGIYWDQNAIFVQGTASPDLSDPNTRISIIKRQAKTAATLDAYRKAAEILAGVRISSGVVAGDSPTIRTRINAYVQSARVCKAKYYADGGVDMVVKVPLAGLLAKADLPDLGTRVAAAPSAHTGIIVDATGVQFAPALIPRLVSASGKVLFDSTRVDSDVFYKGNAVHFVTREMDISTAWVGEQPLRIKADRLGAYSPSDIVVDDQTAALLAPGPAFLGAGGVAIITHPTQEIPCPDIALGDESNRIDWQNRLVMAKGMGRIDASLELDEASRMRRMERAAEVVAQQNLLSAFMNIRLDNQKTVQDLSGARQHMSGILVNAIRCDAHYFSDGSAEIVMAAPLDGMAVRTLGFKPDLKTPPATPVSDTEYTGLVVDASQVGFREVMAPSLVSTDGIQLFDSRKVAAAYVMQHGPVGYAPSIGEARNHPRIGHNPMVVKAVGLDRHNPSRILIDRDDARPLANRLQPPTFINQGRVILVVGEADPTYMTVPEDSGAARITKPTGIILPSGSASQKTHRSGGWSFPGPQKNK